MFLLVALLMMFDQRSQWLVQVEDTYKEMKRREHEAQKEARENAWESAEQVLIYRTGPLCCARKPPFPTPFNVQTPEAVHTWHWQSHEQR